MDNKKTEDFVNDMWDSSIIPEISEYIKIPNKSPSFDPDWDEHGHMIVIHEKGGKPNQYSIGYTFVTILN